MEISLDELRQSSLASPRWCVELGLVQCGSLPAPADGIYVGQYHRQHVDDEAAWAWIRLVEGKAAMWRAAPVGRSAGWYSVHVLGAVDALLHVPFDSPETVYITPTLLRSLVVRRRRWAAGELVLPPTDLDRALFGTPKVRLSSGLDDGQKEEWERAMHSARSSADLIADQGCSEIASKQAVHLGVCQAVAALAKSVLPPIRRCATVTIKTQVDTVLSELEIRHEAHECRCLGRVQRVDVIRSGSGQEWK